MPDKPDFKHLLGEAKVAAKGAKPAELAKLRTSYLGRKGKLTTALRAVGGLPASQRKAAGRAGNAAKGALEKLLPATEAASSTSNDDIDITLPGKRIPYGHRHPVSLVLDEIVEVFSSLGFSVADGPEVEDDWHNFEALNMGPDHPARDMQDTFYVDGTKDSRGVYKLLPRTHTSGVQIRYMEGHQPPLRIIVPGKIFRNEAEDVTHSAVFHQLEGLMVDETTSFADLKGILTSTTQRLIGEGAKLRFRPSFFPYTEPSAEIDMSHPDVLGGRWIELGGAGMVHPQVLRNVKIDPKKFQGFAFGFGVERIAMLKYGIDDLRPFFRPDIRLLEQF